MTYIYKLSKAKLAIRLLIFLVILPNCKKFIQVDPPVTSLNEGTVYKEDATAAAAINGIYAKMSNSGLMGNITVLLELSADNLRLFNLAAINYTAYYQNALVANAPGNVTKFWFAVYPYIYSANAAIKGLSGSTTLTPTVKQNLLGEVYFLRAFYYFYLVNLYGDVPLALTTDYNVNNNLSRTSVAQVYSQIIADLIQAQSLLGDNYLNGDALTPFETDAERVKPNRSAATALLARVYLYQKDWVNAEQAATNVINKTSQYSTLPLNEIFLKNSKETIWALQPVGTNANTNEADLFTLRIGEPNNNSARSMYLSQMFVDFFQNGDQRKNNWTTTRITGGVTYPYPAKYKALPNSGSVTEYPILLRIAEQYLIRAEAKIEQDRIAEGIADLNILRDRATDKNELDESKKLKMLSTTLSKDEAIIALNYERRVEMFCEGGHRWFDLKRNGQIDSVMTNISTMKGGPLWQPYRALYPIPSDEITANSALSQNIGYNN